MKENDFFLPPKKKNGDVVLFMFLFFLLLPGFSIAQYKAQLNIDIKNGTLVNVFENIQKQSAYRFGNPRALFPARLVFHAVIRLRAEISDLFGKCSPPGDR